jgi:8-oxo-dGTP pyrophosphatase MutT (NUDIX family)
MSAVAKTDHAPHLEPRAQYGALPYRFAGGLKVLLITSRETRRWVIPKGWPMKGRSPHAAAAREALEEAGVVGQISKKPLGSYAYEKRMKTGQSIPCRVDVFPLKVSAQKRTWPEKDERAHHWFDWEEAADAVHEPELADLIRRLRQVLKGKAKPKAG